MKSIKQLINEKLKINLSQKIDFYSVGVGSNLMSSLKSSVIDSTKNLNPNNVDNDIKFIMIGPDGVELFSESSLKNIIEEISIIRDEFENNDELSHYLSSFDEYTVCYESLLGLNKVGEWVELDGPSFNSSIEYYTGMRIKK